MIKKNILAGILIIFISTSCSPNRLDGIFELKLGMTESQLKEIVDTTLLVEKTKKNRNERYNEIVGDRIKVFHLDHYVSEDNHILENITLSFFDNKLYRIDIYKYNFATGKLLTENFGEPEIKRKESKKPRNKNSITEITQIWQTNDRNVVCWANFEMFPDRSIFSYFLIIEDRRIKSWINKQLEDE